jgi:hypothetical protein
MRFPRNAQKIGRKIAITGVLVKTKTERFHLAFRHPDGLPISN